MGALIAFALIFANPFSAIDYLNTASEDLAFKLIAGWLPGDATRLVVVVADDSYLRTAEAAGQPATWPLGYGVYRNMVSRISRAEPRALFLDVAFVDETSDSAAASFASTLALASTRFPILLAAGSVETGAPRPFTSAIERVVPRHPVPPGVRPGLLPVSVIEPHHEGLIHPFSLKSDSAGRPNAALALLQATGGHEPAAKVAPLGEIDLVWSLPSAAACGLQPKTLSAEIAAGCALAPRDTLLRLGQLFWSGLATGLCGQTRAPPGGLLCDFTPPVTLSGDPFPVLSLEQLLYGNEAQVNALLTGAVVVFGQDFAFARDRAYSPVYGSRPAALRIATAYANLVHFGDRALRPLPDGWKAANQYAICLAVLGCILRVERQHGRVGPAAEAMSTILLLGLALAIAVLQTVIWRMGPENWLGITAVAKLAQGGSSILQHVSSRMGFDASR